MVYNYLSIECTEHLKNECVNVSEIYDKHIREHHSWLSKAGWEFCDLQELTERYCELNARELLRSTVDFKLDIALILGPRDFLIDRIEADLTIGEIYSIDLIWINKRTTSVIGRFNLMRYIKNISYKTGESKLIFDNDLAGAPLHWLKLKQSEKIVLRVSGAVRIRSNINCIIQLEVDPCSAD
jgi:hypothetical protein